MRSGFTAGQIHTSGSPFVEKQPMSLSTLASLYPNAAPNKFSPYNAIFTSINVPSSSTNYGPANVQIFSLKSAVRYALCISQASISSSFNAAIVKYILTESLDITDKNVIEEGAAWVGMQRLMTLVHIMPFLPNHQCALFFSKFWSYKCTNLFSA